MSYLARFRFEHGEYWDDTKSANDLPLCLGSRDDVLGDALGFCSCGAPDVALQYVLKILRLVDLKHPRTGTGVPYEEWNTWYGSVYRPQICDLFHNDGGAEYLAYYLLTDKGLLEHGGSVPGWLTDKGRDILADLETHFPDKPFNEPE